MTVAWQARICDAHDRVLGAGFLLSGRRVLTCAHVVATAARPLRVYFPALPDLDALEVTAVDSESWYGAQDRRGDVALLHLPADPPLPEPASLGPVGCAAGMEVRALGYPTKHERDGHWAVAKVIGPGGPGQEWYEIHGTNVTGGRIEKGFSGAAVCEAQPVP